MAKKRRKAKKKGQKTRKKVKKRHVITRKTSPRSLKKTTTRVKTRIKAPKLPNHRPWIAALLNFFIWGSGFMYTGRFMYGMMWLIAAIALLIPFQLTAITLSQTTVNFMTAGYFLISFLLAWDAYYDEVMSWHKRS